MLNGNIHYINGTILICVWDFWMLESHKVGDVLGLLRSEWHFNIDSGPECPLCW